MNRKSSTIENDNNKPPGVSPRKWKEIITKHEKRDVVYEIREEIISEVLRQCQDIYIKRKAADILVECAEEAWIRLFNTYNPQKDQESHCGWKYDHCCEPCPTDSWASKNIPIELKKIVKNLPEERFSESEKEKKFSVPDGVKFSIQMPTPRNIDSISSFEDLKKVEYGGSKSDSDILDMEEQKQLEEEIQAEELIANEEYDEDVEDEDALNDMSNFTKIKHKRKLSATSLKIRRKYTPFVSDFKIYAHSPIQNLRKFKNLRTEVKPYRPRKGYKAVKKTRFGFIDMSENECHHKKSQLSESL